MSKDKDNLHILNTSGNQGSQPALLQQIKENSLSILISQLESLFAHCDDLFFDLSSKASSNSEQNLYFESMRELRIRKGGVINQYRHNVEQLFIDCTQPDNISSAQDSRRHDTLSLVQHDEIEQEVAINGMSSKARNLHQEALYQLGMRLDYLIHSKQINSNNNPLDPQQLCKAFAQACQQLELNIKARIIVFKQFDRIVLSKLGSIYSLSNELMTNAGVLPSISFAAQNNRATSSDQDHSSESGDQKNATAPDSQGSSISFSELSALLGSMRRLGLGNIPNYQSYTSNPGPQMSQQELLATLTLMQLQASSQPAGERPQTDLRQLVESVLAKSDADRPQSVKQSDEDVINLVAMFFDFVLDDHNLPDAVQALISRLQIPILKVALKDHDFFSDSKHPARRLVNGLAAACVGMDGSGDIKTDKTYKLIANIVQEIIESTSDTITLFCDKLDQLNEFIQRDAHRSALIEKRTSQAAEGQARTQLAKTVAQKLLFDQLSQAQLPEHISQFLIEQWQQIMVLTHIKEGDDSPEWLDSCQLVQDMVWIFRPQHDDKSIRRVEKIKGDLLQRVETGLRKIINTDEELNSQLQHIQTAIDGLSANSPEQPPVEAKPLSIEQAKALGHTPGSGSKSWKEMTALERQQARHKALTYEFIKKAEELALNSWLQYEDNKSGRSLRCKLSAKIEASDSYIFVNRFGFKVIEKNRKDFAYDMQQGRAKILESGMLFDRAMSSITHNIRQLTPPSADAG